MSSYHVYLNLKHRQDAKDERLQHIVKTVDKDLHEIRIYQAGADFHGEPHDRPLPYGVIDGKPKSDENFFKEIIGEKTVDED
tara:strand:- start:593 stop:838 length:246 start_codon:yes stop_codon:yes gene_type:complete